MAALQRPSTTTTASACIPDTARGTHVFTVAGYRLHKGIGVGNFIRSATFAVGGYDWCVRYYPDGDANEDYISVCVELQSRESVVRALYDLKLTNQTTGMSSLICSRQSSFPVFDSRHSCGKNSRVKGQSLFMERGLQEASPYLKDDCIVIECDVTVLLKKIPAVAIANAKTPQIEEPPSDLSNNLAKLLEGKKGADLMINVSGETFHAHKIVLAMRSPVFEAELYGPMAMCGTEKQCIEIVDMQPAVFEAFLHFIYTDSLPAMDDLLDSHDKREVIRHLLVAADRYAMDRLKLMCEAILCKGLDAKSVVATLALADQHRCSKLRDACIEYIKLFC